MKTNNHFFPHNPPARAELLSAKADKDAQMTLIQIGQIVLVLILTLFFSFNVKAQEYQFKVLANKGDNTLVTSDGSRNEHLKVGSILQEGDKIILSEGSYVGLMHPNGRTMELKSSGEFEVSSLAEKAGEGNSVAGKYADFLMNRMEEGVDDINENHREYLKVTGAVERTLDASMIKVMMPSSTEVYNPMALLKWSDIGAEKYIVTVKNMYDEVLFTKETSENQIQIDLNEKSVSSEKLVIVRIADKNNPSLASDDYGIKRIEASKAELIHTDLAALKASLEEENALDKLILASFYEEHNLLVDALASYEEAMTTNPTVQEYKLAYEQFISRHNLLN